MGQFLVLGVTLDPFWVLGSLWGHFGSVGHFGPVLGLGVTLGPFWVWGSHWANFGSGGQIVCRLTSFSSVPSDKYVERFLKYVIAVAPQRDLK